MTTNGGEDVWRASLLEARTTPIPVRDFPPPTNLLSNPESSVDATNVNVSTAVEGIDSDEDSEGEDARGSLLDCLLGDEEWRMAEAERRW